MIQILYYPGCTLKTQAKNFELSALACTKALGIEMAELDRWNCCGAVYSLATDNLLNHLAPIRNLIRVQEQNGNKVVTLCAMCYNTLKRANLLVKEDKEKRAKINDFMDREKDYDGKVKVFHLLDLLRDFGFEKIEKIVKKPLHDLKVAPYYGCLLLRPKEISIDNPENPQILESLLETLGATVVRDHYRIKCCGSYHIVNNPEIVVERTYTILNSAIETGAEAIVTTCPLCNFNLDQKQKEVSEKYKNFNSIPVFYFTQLLALSLGLESEVCGFNLHHVSPQPLLERKNLLKR